MRRRRDGTPGARRGCPTGTPAASPSPRTAPSWRPARGGSHREASAAGPPLGLYRWPLTFFADLPRLCRRRSAKNGWSVRIGRQGVGDAGLISDGGVVVARAVDDQGEVE